MSWKEGWKELTSKTHTEQGIWWLNGFWSDGGEDNAEEMWSIVHKFIEIDLGRPVRYGRRMEEYKENNDLDQFKSHQILEKLGETMTVMALRKRLDKLDIDNNKRMCITEYLVDKYKKKPDDVVNAPQGDVDEAKLKEAQDACDKAAAALDQAATEAEAARDAKDEADAAVAKVKAAEAELQAAIDEITALEEEKANKIAKCQKIIDDPNAGAVKKGRAVQEKEQTLAEDPLPLRKAKITQKAALKKVTKARKLAEAAAAKAKEASDAAEAAKQAAEDALADAQKQLDELKKQGGSPLGKLWWMERVLKEKKRYS